MAGEASSRRPAFANRTARLPPLDLVQARVRQGGGPRTPTRLLPSRLRRARRPACSSVVPCGLSTIAIVVSFRLHEITVDCADVPRAANFWAGLLGGELREPMPGWLRLGSTDDRPMLNFQPVPEPKQGKARVHLDLLTDDLDAAVARVRALGGRETGERHDYDEGSVIVLADPEGTEFCLVAYRTQPDAPPP
jgi:predicted enzyme related to lactoylglutathione lyase